MSLPEVTLDRIRAYFDSVGLLHFNHETGLPIVGFENSTFASVLNPSVRGLNCYGWWLGTTQDPAVIATLEKLVIQHNSTRHLPKAFVMQENDDTRVYVDYSMPYMAGMTDEQLDAFYQAMFTTSFELFAELEQACPDLVTWETEA